ncbi:class F sortase [Blastococcus capsensis]|uniref:class F sortase n=1 Tax=Blastococcus capsensis TaxID=1564163 RepID=UPI00253FE838|nr:class F sortase [Blastococcus capsensis]MDK3257956.1 class F sortase [Blastococcus capsensis]
MHSPQPGSGAHRRARAGSGSRSRRVRAAGAGLVAAALLVTSFFAGMVYAESSAPAQPVAAAEQISSDTPAQEPAARWIEPLTSVPAVSRDTGAAPPVEVSIPAIGVQESLIGLRVRPDGELQAPEDYGDAGWWSAGPAPGDPGAALFVGHVDSQEGPAVFYRLRELQPGDVVSVRRSDGTTAEFVVQGSETFSKEAIPDEVVYRSDGKPSLHLVTCGGTFDRATGNYRDNVVVFADLVEDPGTPPDQAVPEDEGNES